MDGSGVIIIIIFIFIITFVTA